MATPAIGLGRPRSAAAGALGLPVQLQSDRPDSARLPLPLLPADAAPYDARGRRDLALNALTFFVRLHGHFPGMSVYQLPAPPWFGGYDLPATRLAFDMIVPGSLPLYLLADADDSGRLDPARTTVSVNGTLLPDLASYVHDGISALSYGQVRQFAVLDMVFAPPAPGKYRIEVRSRFQPRPAAAHDDASPPASAGAPQVTVTTYDLLVVAPDSLGPIIYRDHADALFALAGPVRRRIPDTQTAQCLGYDPSAAVATSAAFLDAIPEAAPLPVLRPGLFVCSELDELVYRLRDGQREWLRDPSSHGANPRTATLLEPIVLQSIPPILQHDMLLRSSFPEVYHVDRDALRKVPSWDWVVERELPSTDAHYVPARILSRLPQNSPEWVMPGGASLDLTFHSASLGRALPYRIYLPAGYAAPAHAGRRYPVLYLLHGLSGRYDEWSGYGVELVANELLAAGEVGDMIIIMPQGGFGYWVNQDGGLPWGDYVAHDLVDHIDATYRTIPRREARAIGGLSMGAHGAVQLALNYPEVFGVVGAHSPAIRDMADAPPFFGGPEEFAARDPVTLVQRAAMPSPPVVWIDTGERDAWRPSAEALRRALLGRGWPHEWHLFPGGHDGWYWGDHLWDYLRFYWRAFASAGLPLTRTLP